MKIAHEAREWLRHNAHRADHSEEVVTVGMLRAWARRVVALDDIDARLAREIDRFDGPKREDDAERLRAELAEAADAVGPAWFQGDVSLPEAIRRKCSRLESLIGDEEAKP